MTTDPEEHVRRLLAGAAAQVSSNPPDPAALRGGPPLRRGARGPRWLPAAAAAVAVVAIAGGVVWANRGGSHSPASVAAATPSGSAASNPPATTASTTSTAATKSSAPMSTSPSDVGPAGACTAADLTGYVVSRGALASQPYLVIGLTNKTSTSCTLGGYPTVALYEAANVDPGAPGSAKPLPIVISHNVFEQPQGGPVMTGGGALGSGAIVRPHSSASFYLGTATAYQGGANLIDIRTIAITVPGDSQPVVLTLPPDQPLPATFPVGQSIPVGVTNLAIPIAGGGGRTLAPPRVP